MATMQPYVMMWYDFLAGDKIMGTRCKRCGAVEFPPLPICNHCSGREMEWVEMSGRGKMVSFSANLIVDPPFAAYGPQIDAVVELEEGPHFISWLQGVNLGEQAAMFERLPINVKMEVQTREKYSYPVFRIVE